MIPKSFAFPTQVRFQPGTDLTPVRSVYVCPMTGDDETGDGTREKPFKTLERATRR